MSDRRKKVAASLLLVGLILLLSACNPLAALGRSGVAEDSKKAVTEQETAQEMEATPTPTPEPESTSDAEPTPTPTPAPEPTPTPTPTPAPQQAQPTPTPTPEAPAPGPSPTPTPPPPVLELRGVRAMLEKPSKVQVVFSLRDQEGRAIVVPPAEIAEGVTISEARSGGSFVPVDLSETAYSVHTVQSFEMEVVLVLDFTESMYESGAIGVMVDGAQALISEVNDAHRIGIVEFHDRNSAPQVLSDLTTDKGLLSLKLKEFSQSRFIPGSSLAWDAVYEGLGLFTPQEQDGNIVKVLVFLSDGYDTSSYKTVAEIVTLGQAEKVQMYNIGFGEVYDEPTLVDMAETTGGAYYSAPDLALLEQQFRTLVRDIQGQYVLGYTTMRRDGQWDVRFELSQDGISATPYTATVDAGAIYGSDQVGSITIDPAFIRRDGKAVLFFRADHIPRQASKLRFKVGVQNPVVVTLPPASRGGLLEGWKLSGPDAQGYYSVISDRPLDFGDFGILFQVEVSDITGPGLVVRVEFDNDIYGGRLSFAHPDIVVLGVVPPQVVITPLPENRAGTATPSFTGKATSAVTFWTVDAVEYRIDGGDWVAAQVVEGAFDSTEEDFQLTVPLPLVEGQHLLEARARNTNGVWTLAGNYARYIFVVDTGPWRTYDFNSGSWPADLIKMGSYYWRFDTNGPYEGQYSLASPYLGDRQAAGIALALDVPQPTTISFRYRVSSQEGADYLRFYVDGQEVQRWSGTSITTWTEYTYTLTPGRHEFNWVYIKDGSGQDGYDAAWIDLIQIS